MLGEIIKNSVSNGVELGFNWILEYFRVEVEKKGYDMKTFIAEKLKERVEDS